MRRILSAILFACWGAAVFAYAAPADAHDCTYECATTTSQPATTTTDCNYGCGRPTTTTTKPAATTTTMAASTTTRPAATVTTSRAVTPTTTPGGPGPLPRTGGDPWALFVVGGALVAAGIVAVAAPLARRRSR